MKYVLQSQESAARRYASPHGTARRTARHRAGAHDERLHRQPTTIRLECGENFPPRLRVSILVSRLARASKKAWEL